MQNEKREGNGGKTMRDPGSRFPNEGGREADSKNPPGKRMGERGRARAATYDGAGDAGRGGRRDAATGWSVPDKGLTADPPRRRGRGVAGP